MATEYDLWKIFPRMPKKVTIGDITIRDGFQHCEKFVSTQAKIFYGQEMILAGAKEIEVTNLGSAVTTPQFADAEEVLTALRSDEFKKRCGKAGINYDEIVHDRGDYPGNRRGPGHRVEEEGNRSRPDSHDGFH